MNSSSDSFTIHTTVSISFFLVDSSGTLHSAIALVNSELTKGNIWLVLFDFSLIIHVSKSITIYNLDIIFLIICPCLFHDLTFKCSFRYLNTSCSQDLIVTGKLCVNVVVVWKFMFFSFNLSIQAFCKECAIAFFSSLVLHSLFNFSLCNRAFSSSEIPTRFQRVLRFSWVCFVVNAIGFTGISV